jgi:hypothetical protein
MPAVRSSQPCAARRSRLRLASLSSSFGITSPEKGATAGHEASGVVLSFVTAQRSASEA